MSNSTRNFHIVLLFFSLKNVHKSAYLLFAVYPASSITDLSAVDAALKALELQVQAIKNRLREETEAIPKAQASLSLSVY